MTQIFGKRPKMPSPVAQAPAPTEIASVDKRKTLYNELAKRRKATLMNQVTAEPNVLRRKLGGGS